MFHFRSEQWDGFSEQARRDFELRLTDHLTETNPECFVLLGDELITRVIREGIQKAVAYGIETESNVAQFVQMQLEEGSNFEDKPEYAATKEVLLDKELDEFAKVRRLWRSVDESEDLDAQAAEDLALDEEVVLDGEDRDLLVDDSTEDGEFDDDDGDDELDFDDEEEDDENE